MHNQSQLKNLQYLYQLPTWNDFGFYFVCRNFGWISRQAFQAYLNQHYINWSWGKALHEWKIKVVLWILIWSIQLFCFFLKKLCKKIIEKNSITYILCLESENFSQFQLYVKYNERNAIKPLLLFSVKDFDRFNSLIHTYEGYTLLLLQDNTFLLVHVSY